MAYAFGSSKCEKSAPKLCSTSMCKSHCTDKDCKIHGEKAKERKEKYAQKKRGLSATSRELEVEGKHPAEGRKEHEEPGTEP